MPKTKIEIINETVEFYSVPGRRSLNPMGQCVYNGPDGKHCAFARCVANPQDLKEGRDCNHSSLFPLAIFKEGYEGHEPSFWRDIQLLHDGIQFWADHGLTQRGVAYRLELLSIYA